MWQNSFLRPTNKSVVFAFCFNKHTATCIGHVNQKEKRHDIVFGGAEAYVKVVRERHAAFNINPQVLTQHWIIDFSQRYACLMSDDEQGDECHVGE